MTSFPCPDYAGGSLVNLMSSLRIALGAPATDYPEAGLLPASELSAARRIVLLLVDGLGYDYLLQQAPDSVLRGLLRGRLDTVFPTTTAAAITSLSTGLAPQQHAITGWHMWLRELQRVTTILPFRSRGDNVDLSEAGYHVDSLIGAPSLFAGIRSSAAVVSPAWIVDSPYSQASTLPARRFGYRNLEEMFARLQWLVMAADGPEYIYVYWPEFDALAHKHGVSSVEVQQSFTRLDQALGEFLEQISGSDTCLLISADHGFIDTGPEHYVQLAEHPDLAACLRLPLCGEPRAAYCYVHADRRNSFETYAAQVLQPYCECVASAEMIERGYFGLGAAHPELAQRVGDYVLLLKEQFVIKDYVDGEKPFFFSGVHSGLSDAELHIPLMVTQV